MKNKRKAKRQRPTLKHLVKAAQVAGIEITPYLEPVIQVTVSSRMESDLAALANTGLFGFNASDAARRILEEWLWQNGAAYGLRRWPYQPGGIGGRAWHPV